MPRSQIGITGSVHRSPAGNLLRVTGWILTALILLAITGWETLAVYYSNLPEPFRLPGAIGIALVSLGALLMVRPAGRSILIFLSIFAMVVLGFLLIPPSNDRDWQPDVARLSWAVTGAVASRANTSVKDRLNAVFRSFNFFMMSSPFFL